MTLQEYIMLASKEYSHETHKYRYGQVLFNVLSDERPELAERVRGSYFDPFHRDRNIPTFLEWLEKVW